ncbi:TetR/AcrR family transcriptional regulator C-terminal domain-containing protein [Acrocarpospora macrocephala]|uniref:TetR family transcriptional regulator n=1 Tax=Acrocarpospora macrocephala TaxID=150177 RepID=A0A5M3WYU0_9ACTN|nr:TetR/AcrR family transcriptional regulator C-terminal domain-containing protein [Acrocarpospora macrocephala]GES11208.1 TetR family transcriptional regulator [Acrocarpospora macrocephala]
MVVYAGQGDPQRTMALLWRASTADPGRTTRGPKPALTVDAIVAAAIAVADESGLDGWSMRAVGERLGRTAMSLYTYVPTKRELIDLMYDQAHANLATPVAPSSGWRAEIECWAHDLLACYLRHPWLLQVSHARPVLGPHEQAVLESILRILDRTGLPARAIVSSLFSLVRGSAQSITETRSAATTTGTSDQEWWTLRGDLMRQLVPDFAERFPYSARLAKEPAPGNWEDQAGNAFTDGLAILLDGVESAASPT